MDQAGAHLIYSAIATRVVIKIGLSPPIRPLTPNVIRWILTSDISAVQPLEYASYRSKNETSCKLLSKKMSKQIVEGFHINCVLRNYTA